jgi:hypothetical protein
MARWALKQKQEESYSDYDNHEHRCQNTLSNLIYLYSFHFHYNAVIDKYFHNIL